MDSIKYNLPNADITYYPDFIKQIEADVYFNKLRDTIPWQQDFIKLYGKTHAQPRLTALFAVNKKTYTYSNITMTPHPFSKDLIALKTQIETLAKIQFTTCLLNLYRNGKDSNGWHADDEKELGKNPVIASLSLGQERMFHLRNKSNKDLKQKIVLQHGSLLLMKGETQHFWQHQIPKTTRLIKERINLTFRVIL